GQGANGRLTAEGLRLVRALKGGTEMSAAALLLEPVYFASPASEAEVRAEAAALLAHARAALAPPYDPAPLRALEARLAELSEGRRAGSSGARFYPLTLPLSRLPAALELVRSVARQRPAPERAAYSPTRPRGAPLSAGS